MFMNYMDYTADQFMNLYTNGQTTRMRANFNPGGFRQNATYAVGVPIEGPAVVCASATYSVPALPPGLTVTWASSNTSGLTVTNGGVATRVGSFSGSVTLTATINTGCGNTVVTRLVQVGAGTVGGTYQYGGSTYQVNNPGNGISVSNSSPNIFINLTNSQGSAATYAWTVTGQSSSGATFSSSGNTASVYVSGGKYLNCQCVVSTTCGSSTVTFSCYNYSTGSWRVAAYPNPSSENLTVAVLPNPDKEGNATAQTGRTTKSSDTDFAESEILPVDHPVRLVNAYNQMVWQGKLTGGKVSFPTASIPNGLYYLKVEGKQTVTRPILIQH